jgi:hypothetical protein
MLAAVAACSSFDGAEPGPGEVAAEGGADTSLEDAIGSQDGGPEAALNANLLANAGFENGCAGWVSDYGATFTESDTARSGAKSCMVCEKDSSGFGILQITNLPVPGATYVAALWARANPDAAAAPLPKGIEAMLYVANVNNSRIQTGAATQAPALNDGWQRGSAQITDTSDGGRKLVLRIFAEEGPGCFLLDDVELARE